MNLHRVVFHTLLPHVSSWFKEGVHSVLAGDERRVGTEEMALILLQE